MNARNRICPEQGNVLKLPEYEAQAAEGPPDPELRGWLDRQSQSLLDGIAEHRRRSIEVRRWMLAATFAAWFSAAALPLLGAGVWLKIEPHLGEFGPKLQAAAALSLCAAIAILVQLGYVAFGLALRRPMRGGL
jgi:hypothetical protein